MFKKAHRFILIFGIGNSDHILKYRGRKYWNDKVAWSRYIGPMGPRTEVVSKESLTYQQIHDIVQGFKSEARKKGYNFDIFAHINSTFEFCENEFRIKRHPETRKNCYTYNIMVSLNGDNFTYASYPNGIPEGLNAGKFLVDQVDCYLEDMNYDGVLYGNQLGTRGRWDSSTRPGYTKNESEKILEFLRYSKNTFGEKKLMWFDSYNPIEIERKYFSFLIKGYSYFDYIIVSGFCVITDTKRYVKNLNSKLKLSTVTKLLATLDYVDPWYDYNSIEKFPKESKRLEKIAIKYYKNIDGVVMFGNDEYGEFIPKEKVELFAKKFFKK